MDEQVKLGATGEYPEGKINDNDEGAIQFAIGLDADNGVVILDFGSPVTWLGMPPELAEKVAMSLYAHAKKLRQDIQLKTEKPPIVN